MFQAVKKQKNNFIQLKQKIYFSTLAGVTPWGSQPFVVGVFWALKSKPCYTGVSQGVLVILSGRDEIREVTRSS